VKRPPDKLIKPEIRQFKASDFECVTRLWAECGLQTSIGDGVGELTALPHPDLFIVAEENGALVAALLATFDGRRGWLHHLAVDPACRHRGVATLLVRDVERRLSARGCRKVNLLIEPDNAGVQQVYQALGYERDSLVFMERWLEDDGS
jgi:ribosomal protein S18 acetylase RimI-like enzyme